MPGGTGRRPAWPGRDQDAARGEQDPHGRVSRQRRTRGRCQPGNGPVSPLRLDMLGGEWQAWGGGFTMPVMGADPARGGLTVGLLGPVEIGPAGGVMAPVAQPRLRVLLGLLGVAADRLVSVEALVDGVWGEEWSPGRERNLHTLVYQLRRRLAGLEPDKGAERLVRAGTGYRLALGPGELDLAVFGDLGGRGRQAARAGDAAGARELFGRALELWRGAALADGAPL